MVDAGMTDYLRAFPVDGFVMHGETGATKVPTLSRLGDLRERPNMSQGAIAAQQPSADPLRKRFDRARAISVSLVRGLSDADVSVQSMPDASPSKWHLAHTTWFFETFVLRDYVRSYRPFNSSLAFLYNSYYESEGDRIARPSRGMLTRPSIDEVLAYRSHVDIAMMRVLDDLPAPARQLVLLGCNHEEQHQELLLTDLLHLFAQNPLLPAAFAPCDDWTSAAPGPLRWIEGRQGPIDIGYEGQDFAFDCEGPRHTVWVAPHALADRLVTNSEWQAFIDVGGYGTASLWLSDGWAWVRQNQIEAPLYWRRDNSGDWSSQFGLGGLAPIDPAAPVRHVSYYEVDAFARWAGARLPTEAEWESAAEDLNADQGNFLDGAGAVRPSPATAEGGIRQLFGDLWEWTASAYLPYPGFRPVAGAVGEYNGKFMSGQFILRGGSCATPRGHVRASYRNFFYPHQRWQFTGVRLAKDL
jgi:ergothioneine biosynthesis protein EgtB